MLRSLSISCGMMMVFATASIPRQAHAQTAATTCAGLELLANVAGGILTVPLGATNLGMGIGAFAGSKRGVGIGAIVTGALGLIASSSAFALIPALSVAGCNPIVTIAMVSGGLAMGAFALSGGIYRVVVSSRPQVVAIVPYAGPVRDQRTNGIFPGAGLTLIWR